MRRHWPSGGEEEIRRRVTVVGPHRDEVASLDSRPVATYGSEGQQRTVALALKLSQAHLLHTLRQQPPLLLIHDVFGELDPRRRNALLQSLPSGSQKIVTTTTLPWLNETGLRPDLTYRVAQGTTALVTGRTPWMATISN